MTISPAVYIDTCTRNQVTNYGNGYINTNFLFTCIKTYINQQNTDSLKADTDKGLNHGKGITDCFLDPPESRSLVCKAQSPRPIKERGQPADVTDGSGHR